MKFLCFSWAVIPAMLAVCLSAASASYVTPKMGGGQQNAPMVMPNVVFDGTNLSISGILDMTGQPLTDIPVLRPLQPPDEFDPSQPHAVLSGQAYNLQYGWNLSASSQFLPIGGNIWIEQTSATPGLQAYERVTYAPIFGTRGSSTRWLWDGIMAHNAYASPSVIEDWEASYLLYIGDASGNAMDGYGSTTLTLQWTSIPEPGVGLAALGLIGLLGTRRRPRRRMRIVAARVPPALDKCG
jgi:hypothetical protein